MPTARPRLLDRSVHAVAALEGLKGLTALALAFGFGALQHGGLHELAVALVGRLHLDPQSHLPALIVGWSDHLQQVHPGQLISVALAYAALRLAEGWGLWHDRPWAEWLAALATGIYLPFELSHLLHRPGWAAALVLGFNLAILALMVWRLRARRAAA
ncbi:MAG: DUF2127 domain-containing protein [Burkholderiales bacterium]|uniref:DUF2127 domain-containing protein n=1 Tax=Ottowia pentelensis TaxID=511108 RepID=A0ABV6PYA7_9BURK|nr:DUF2127 domain-containing protein [Burkholderiales bacterium]MBS0403640.1 DUF2127 domain-containing protein [Pseudomonadota bacterium]